MEQARAGRRQDWTALVAGLAFLGFSVIWLSSGSLPGMFFFTAFVAFRGWGVVRGVRPFLARLRIGEPVISTSSRRLPVGADFVVACQHTWRRPVEVNRIVAELVLRETAHSTSGTKTRTATHEEVVQRLETPGRRFEAGEVFRQDYTLRIPSDGMHTFTASDNRIGWYVKVSMELPRWPDLRRYYDITVAPELAG